MSSCPEEPQCHRTQHSFAAGHTWSRHLHRAQQSEKTASLKHNIIFYFCSFTLVMGMDSPVSMDSLTTHDPSTRTASHSIVNPPRVGNRRTSPGTNSTDDKITAATWHSYIIITRDRQLLCNSNITHCKVLLDLLLVLFNQKGDKLVFPLRGPKQAKVLGKNNTAQFTLCIRKTINIWYSPRRERSSSTSLLIRCFSWSPATRDHFRCLFNLQGRHYIYWTNGPFLLLP